MSKLIIKMIVLWMALYLPLQACAVDTQANIRIYENIEMTESFRGWEEKGFGEAKGKSQISLIRSPSVKGEIILLRWNKDKTDFNAEVYVLDETYPTSTIWHIKTGLPKKSLVVQHNGSLLITELIPGKDGGQKTERFVLPGN